MGRPLGGKPIGPTFYEDDKVAGTATDDDRIQLDDDLPFQRRQWTFERIGWVAMAAFLLGGLLGLLGNGPLSHATAADPTGVLRVEYDRIVRATAPAHVRLFVARGAADAGGRVHLRVGRDYLASVHVERIDPVPETVLAGADHDTYVLRGPPNDPAGTLPVVIRVEPTGFGRRHLDVGVELPDGRSADVHVTQLALP